MKRGVLVAGAVLLFAGIGAATPTLTDVTVGGDDAVWLSEEFDITATCKDISKDESSYTVFGKNISHQDNDGEKFFSAGPDDLGMAWDNNEWHLSGETFRDALPFAFTPGRYAFFVNCTDGGTSDSMHHSFVAKELVADITGGLGEPIYTGRERTAFVAVEEHGKIKQPLEKGDEVDFTVRVGGGERATEKYYDGGEDAWGVTFQVAGEPGTYDVNITARHGGGQASVAKTVEVEDPLQFDATVSDRKISGRETIDLEITASHEGDALEVGVDDITLSLDGTTLSNVTATTVSPGSSTFDMVLPNRSRGTYPLDILFSRDGLQASETIQMRYPLPISGEFVDRSDNPLPFSLRFRQDGETVKTISAKGSYSGQIVPGSYDVRLAFPDPVFGATIALSDVSLDQWDHPIQYEKYTALGDVPGLVPAGLYAYRSTLDAASRTFTLGYTTTNIEDPRTMTVFRCTGWNIERKRCYGDWQEIGAEFQRVGGKVRFDGAGEGAYAIGVREDLTIQYSTDATTYTPGETVEVTGTVQGGGGDRVPNASITLSTGSEVVERTTTNGNGVFAAAMPAPARAGNHSLTIDASKEPYADAQLSFDIHVERPSRIKILAPSEIRVHPGTPKNVSIYVRNTGFTTLHAFRVDGGEVPFLRRISHGDPPILRNQSKEVRFQLYIPPDTAAKTYTAEPAFTYNGEEEKRAFGITVEKSAAVNSSVSSTGEVSRGTSFASVIPDVEIGSGGDILGSIPADKIILAVIALQIIVAGAVVMRRRSPDEREHLTRMASHIKAQIGGEDVDESPGRVPTSWNNDGLERERVMRTVSHIKNRLRG